MFDLVSMNPIKKAIKWIFISLLILLVVVSSVMIGAVQFINSAVGREWLLKQVNAVIIGDISAAHIQLNPLKGYIELNQMVLKDAHGISVTGFDRFFVNIYWPSLLKKELRISEIRLQKPWGRLYMTDDGRLNLLQAVTFTRKKSSEEKKTADGSQGIPINIVIEYLSIEGGDISFDYPAKAITSKASGVDLRSDGNLISQTAHLRFDIAQFGLKTATMELPESHLKIAAGLENDQFALNNLNLNIGNSTLNIEGIVADIFSLKGVELSGRSKINIAEMAESFRLPGTWKGAADLVLDLSGEVNNPNIDLTLGLKQPSLFNHKFDQIQLTAALHDRQLKLTDSQIALGEGTVRLSAEADLNRAFADGFLKPPVDLEALTFKAVLDQDTPQIGQWVPEVQGLDGSVKSHLTLSGKGVSLPNLTAALNMSIQGRSLSAPGVKRPLQGAFKLKAALDHNTFQLQDLDGLIDGIKFKGAGRYDPKNRMADAQMVLDAQDLSQPLALVGLSEAKGRVNLSLDLSGTLNEPSLGVVVDSKDLGYGNVSIGTLQLAADVSPNRVLQISSLKLSNQGSTADGRAQIRLLEGWKGIDPNYDQSVELRLNDIEVKDFYNQDLIRGELNGHIIISGLLEDLRGAVKFEADGLATESVRIGDIRTFIRLVDNSLYLDEFLLMNKESRLKGSGQILLLDDSFGHLLEDPQFQIAFSGTRINLKNFIDGVAGEFEMGANFNGSIRHPLGTLTLDGNKIDTGVQKIAGIDLLAVLDGDSVKLNPLRLNLTATESLVLRGRARMDRTFDFELRSSGIQLTSVDVLKEKVGDFQGRLKTYISGHGSIDEPVVDGSLLLENIEINKQPIEDFRLHVNLHDHLARIYGDLNFNLDASYHLIQKDFAANLDFYQTQLNTYLRIAGQSDLNGFITGQIGVKGNVERINDIVAHLNLDEVTLNLKNTPLIKTHELAAHMIDHHIQVDNAEINFLDKGELSVKGAALLGGPIDLSVHAQVPISDAGNFTEMLADANGEIFIDAEVKGSLPKPQIYLNASLDNIGMTIPETGQKIERINGTIELDPQKISLNDISGRLDSGRFTVGGSITHDFFTPTKIDLNIVGDGLPVEMPDMLSLLLNAKIRIVGEKGKAEARGEIVLVNGIYYRDVNINLLLLESIGKRSRSVSPPSEPLKIPFFDEIVLNINVSHREPFLVQNNLAEMEIRPDLSIGGNLSQPVVKGRADVTSGTITFKKKVFDITRGVIDFVNPYKTEMMLDIEGNTTISENNKNQWEITLTLKGTPDNLELNLSSVPEETDADILSLLIFGQKTGEWNKGDSQNKTSTRQLLTGIIADTLSGELKNVTGMDILELETGTDSSSDEQEAQKESERVKVTVGKHLSDRMTIKVDLESKNGEMIQRAISEYKFLENILLKGFQDTQGVFGGEIVFRIEFR